jgi:hypothetical protein
MVGDPRHRNGTHQPPISFTSTTPRLRVLGSGARVRNRHGLHDRADAAVVALRAARPLLVVHGHDRVRGLRGSGGPESVPRRPPLRLVRSSSRLDAGARAGDPRRRRVHRVALAAGVAAGQGGQRRWHRHGDRDRHGLAVRAARGCEPAHADDRDRRQPRRSRRRWTDLRFARAVSRARAARAVRRLYRGARGGVGCAPGGPRDA